jgi:hypothetical protein
MAEGPPLINAMAGGDDDAHIVVMECLENGTLATLIFILQKRNLTVPNKILWRFLRCCKCPSIPANSSIYLTFYSSEILYRNV